MAITEVDSQTTGRPRGIGPAGTAARVIVGGLLLGSVAQGHVARGFHLSSWVLGLVGFPVLLRRDDQVGCAVFWPVDQLERR